MKKKAIGGAGDARIIGGYIVHNILVATYDTGKETKRIIPRLCGCTVVEKFVPCP